MKTLRRASFRRWLETQRETPFKKNSNTSCALAAYTGGRVGYITWRDTEHTERRLPYWAYTFIRIFDSQERDLPGGVSGEKALNILDQIPNKRG